MPLCHILTNGLFFVKSGLTIQTRDRDLLRTVRLKPRVKWKSFCLRNASTDDKS